MPVECIVLIFLWENGNAQCFVTIFFQFCIGCFDTICSLLSPVGATYLLYTSQFIFGSIAFLERALTLSNKVIELNLIVHFWNGLVSTKEDKRYEFLMCDYSSLHRLCKHSKQVNVRSFLFLCSPSWVDVGMMQKKTQITRPFDMKWIR